MDKIRIIDSDKFISKNFSFSEYYKPEFGKAQEFQCPKALISAVQYIRDYFNIPFKITCTIGVVNWGFHPVGLAVDTITEDSGKAIEVLKSFETACLNYQKTKKDVLISNLRSLGVTGFGVEGYCIHLDCRQDHFNSKDIYGKYTIFRWTNDGTKYGKSEVLK